MLLPKNALVVVADGEKFTMFHNIDSDQGITLESLPTASPEPENSGAGARHQNSAANPSGSQGAEDNFAAGITTLLNNYVENENPKNLVIIAAPRTLGELRKHYSKKLTSVLLREIAKDLTSHSTSDIEQVLRAA